MDLSYGAEYEVFRKEVQSFLAAKWPAKQAGEDDPGEERIQQFRTEAVAAGYLSRSIPRKYGGSEQELDLLKSAVIDEEFRRVGAPEEPADLGYALLVPTLLECNKK